MKIKRVYEPAEKGEFRILVDRLWPRGVSKKKAKIDLWLKIISPSDELRKWFSHDPQKWSGFKKKYFKELKSKKQELAEIRLLKKKHKNLTLLFSAKDPKHNNAVALLEYLKF